jgi:DNA-binding GntR family transcriptional regulator
MNPSTADPLPDPTAAAEDGEAEVVWSAVVPAPLGGTSYHRVRDAIRHEIITGAFGQGEWLKMARLVERYGLSPAPIREALNQLEGEGFVELLPNRGARVRSITRSFVADLFEIRLALEPLLAERSAAVATAEDVAVLDRLEALMEDAMAGGDTPAQIRGNRDFHHALHRIRPNKPAIDLLNQHSALVSSVRRRFGFPEARHRTIIDEHRRLIAACRARDGAAAHVVMREHVRHSIEELLPRIPES